MAKWPKNAVVSEDLASKFKTEKETPYTRWVKAEGLDIIPSFYVQNLQHRRAEAVGAPRRQCGVPQPRRLAHLERLLRDGNSAGQKPQPAPAALRGNDPGAVAAAARPRCGTTPAPASPSNGRTARCSPFRSIAITSISTVRARSRRAMSPSPMRRRSSISTKTSISSSTPNTTSRIASPASRIISRPRASRRAFC